VTCRLSTTHRVFHAMPKSGLGLDPELYPALSSAVSGQDGAALREELNRLIASFRPTRATRRPANVIVKLLRVYAGEELEESVVLRDISESGMRITLPAHVDIALGELARSRFRVRLQGKQGPTLVVSAVLVRISAVNEHGANLAFRFEGLSEGERAAIAQG
jgi:PilZ domain